MVKAIKKVIVCAMAAVLTFGTAGAAANASVKSPTTSVKPVTKNDVKADNGAKVDVKKNGTADLNQIKKTNKTSVSVASTVTVNGVKYKVTTVSAKAFANAPKAKKITLPGTITKIEKNAFKGAKKLKSVVINTKKAVTIQKGAFNGVNTKKMTITVNKKMSKKELTKFKKNLKKAGYKGKVVKAK